MLHEFYDSEFPLIRLGSLMHRSVDLLAQWRQIISRKDTTDLADTEPLLESLLIHVVLLDADLSNWELTAPSFLNYGIFNFEEQRLQPRWMLDLLDQPGCPPIMHYYDCLQNLYGWNLYRMVRILLNRAILNSVSTFPFYNLPIGLDLQTSLLVIKKMADDICSSVLSALTVSIPGKPPAVSKQDICGFRVQGLAGALELVRVCLGANLENPESQLRADWVDSVISFIANEIHRGKPRWR
jgi:hypothetical protein